MSILMKILYGVCAVLMVAGSFCVIIAALFQPKEYKGDGNVPKEDTWNESIEDA